MFCGYCGKQNKNDYSYCIKCGKPLEFFKGDEGTSSEIIDEKPAGKILSSAQDLKKIDVEQHGVPVSKYRSVIWWKDCEWPWQAKSLDEKNVLGCYETEEKAAEAIADFYKGLIKTYDLLKVVNTGEERKLMNDLKKRIGSFKNSENSNSKHSKKPSLKSGSVNDIEKFTVE